MVNINCGYWARSHRWNVNVDKCGGGDCLLFFIGVSARVGAVDEHVMLLLMRKATQPPISPRSRSSLTIRC